MNVRRIGADLVVVYRSYTRNPVALFFSLIFPIILIGLFGLIFSTVGTSATTLYVVNDDHGSAPSEAFLAALNETKVVTVSLVHVNASQFASWLGKNDEPVGLVIPAGFGYDYLNNLSVNVTIYTDPLAASSSGVALGAVEEVVNEFNVGHIRSSCGAGPGCTPVVGLSSGQVGSRVYSYIDYLIPGLIGFSILTSPMFSLVDISSSYRKEGIFRELSLTPLTRSEWLTSRVIWYVALTFASAAIMLGTGVVVFGARVSLTADVLPFLVVGPFFFVSLGMLCGSAAPTPESAALIGNIVTFPMMFLSGTFFPVSSFPAGLQEFAHVLPLFYVIDGLNQVMLFANPARALVDLAIVAVAAAVVFALAVRLFRWRDE
jgi:ABC-2 type transport system permease protein